MNFKIDPKDLLIFIIFCLFLLDICAIGVVNASYLVTEGHFYGLLPFKAFTPRYIAATFTFFLLALVGIFLAVNSYIFDRESGFGFSLGKTNHGYARWARKGEIKKQLKLVDPKAPTANAAGVVVINNGKQMGSI